MYNRRMANTRTPGQRAGLSQSDVVAAARAILHGEGVAAVSMRRIAAGLGVAPNALYSHVADKDALLDLLLDSALADIDLSPAGGWRDCVEAVLADVRRALLADADLVPLFLTRQTIGPNAVRVAETVLGHLDRGGVRGPDGVRVFQVLLVHTVGATAFELGRRDDPDPPARRRRGRQTALALDPAGFPHMTSQATAMSQYPGDTVFRLGLRLIMDGLAASR